MSCNIVYIAKTSLTSYLGGKQGAGQKEFFLFFLFGGIELMRTTKKQYQMELNRVTIRSVIKDNTKKTHHSRFDFIVLRPHESLGARDTA